MTTFPRRLSVIVSADVVGYNRLLSNDEEGTRATLQKHRDAINSIFIEDGGRVVKTTGDGMLLEFPSAFHAVRASLGAQRVIAERNKDVPPNKRLEFRMGMHLGDVVVDDDDASGDGINIAERLQEIAEPGGICLSRAAHAAVHKDFDSLFADGGSKALKDFDAPVHIYKLAPEAAMLTHIPAVTVPRQLLSLAVLPFANSSGAARNDFLADSITDQLTSELARIEDSFVVDRKTALAAATHQGDNLAVLGRGLGIGYAIRGSVGVSEAGLRIDAALIDVETGTEIWDDRLDIAIGDPFVMQHEVNARLVPLVYDRLLAATGHTAPRALAPVSPQLVVPTSQPLSIVPLAVRELPPVAEPEAAEPRTAESAAAEISGLSPPQPGVAPSVALPPTARVEDLLRAAVHARSQAGALTARWQVLRRPLPRRPVDLALAAVTQPPPLRIIASENMPAPTPAVRPAVGSVQEIAQAPVAVSLPVIEAPREIAEPELASAPQLTIQPEMTIAAEEPPPVSLLMIEPAPENAIPEPAPVVPLIIRPRTMTTIEYAAGRIVSFQPRPAPRSTWRLARAEIIEMPTPPRTDRPEWRMAFWLRAALVTIAGALGGAIALAKLGFARETVVSIGSWILIATGLAQLTGVSVEAARSARLLQPAGPAWVEPQRIKRPRRARAKVISVRAVLRSPRGTSRSRQYAP